MVLGKMLLAMILSLGITLASYPVAIPILHKLKFGQTVREEGPESRHLQGEGEDHHPEEQELQSC